MTEAKHTPGPWTVVAGDNYRIEADAIPAAYPHLFNGDDLGQLVAMVGNRQDDFGAADAALIASAPDLLMALREIADDYADRFDMESPSTNPGMKYVVQQARQAIAKATRAQQ